MRRNILLVGVIFGLAVLTQTAPAAAGDVHFSIGTGFSIGGVSFHLAYASPGYGYAPYYYRTGVHLGYTGYSCADGCFRRSGHYYHDPYCPVARYHFGLYQYPIGVYRTPTYGHYSYYRGGSRGHHYYRQHGRHYRPPYRYDYRHRGRHGSGYHHRGRSHRGGYGYYGYDRYYNREPGSAGKTRPPRRRD